MCCLSKHLKWKKVQIKRTKKLFYNKYPYKVETTIRGASLLVRRGIPETKRFCESKKANPFSMSSWARDDYTESEKQDLKLFCENVEKFFNKEKYSDLRIRAEGRHLNFFTADEKVLAQIKIAADLWISCITEPASKEDLEFMMANGAKKILVDELPHGRYGYKIILKTNMKADRRESFGKWLSKYPEESVKPTKSTNGWLTGTTRYVQDPYIYVSDRPMLSMLGLFASGDVKRVEEFVLRNTLTTE